MNVNDATLTGRLTADPDLRETKTGKKCCNFTLAVKRRLPKNATEEQKKNDADFIRCVAWGERAESIARDGSKGQKMLVKGEYHTSRNEKDGKVYNNTELTVKHYEFMSSSKSDDKAEEKKDAFPPFSVASSDIPL